MVFDPDAWLECDDCGHGIRRLNHAERMDMALNPYNWIAYCGPCRRERAKEFQ